MCFLPLPFLSPCEVSLPIVAPNTGYISLAFFGNALLTPFYSFVIVEDPSPFSPLLLLRLSKSILFLLGTFLVLDFFAGDRQGFLSRFPPVLSFFP